ncbi:MAG: LUD domain-containing protein [Bacteroidetes bacterium]|nr:LUD domain-containing protein [Bacteroidota bacterium]
MNMKDSTPKEQILANIRNALIDKATNAHPGVEMQGPVFKAADPDESPDIVFADMFSEAGGQFIYCENESVMADLLQQLMHSRGWTALWCKSERLANFLEAAEIPFFMQAHASDDELVSITTCERLISETGSIMISDLVAGGRELYSMPDVHLVLAFASQVRTSLKAAFSDMKAKYPNGMPPMLTTITGPSRTADIEKTLVKGAHGPKELFLFLIDDLQ